ncbi:hypothetical protein H4K36_01315 [Streptomyces sp. DHE7-1]|nr:hypothetical protein [Streptomyces sp. DHE7-1]
MAHDVASSAEARELAGWADPRAMTFFSGSRRATAWLKALQEHAPYLLLADGAVGVWPATPILEDWPPSSFL